ncbi:MULTISPECIES: hypothetical protein [Chloracidobacterium]|jgi:hypothetical protein|uniref:Uncharacterized protein n=1 Tax=Chloracidobacterium thermophilum (strain B) TaxID=981222 RepID=G2LK36_CHLTF|nr:MULTISPECIES: hypothetical protein [Chloracidobacterium]AEP13203.1 hypothetical protein Cabther_B0200 [Chloracidobacterium thermophilum B]
MQPVSDPDNFITTEGTFYSWVRDTTGQHESAPPVRWLADLKIRHQVEPAGDVRLVRLEATPRAELYFTLDGSNPRDGGATTVPSRLVRKPAACW